MNDILDFDEEKIPKNNRDYHSDKSYTSLKLTVTLIFAIFVTNMVLGIETMLLTTFYLIVIVVNTYGVIHGIQGVLLHREIDVWKKWSPFIANINMFIINLFVLYVIMN